MSFLKFLEETCPGDDAHDGLGDQRPLLERCGMCREIYEKHQNEVAKHIEEAAKIAEGPLCSCKAEDIHDGCCSACGARIAKQLRAVWAHLLNNPMLTEINMGQQRSDAVPVFGYQEHGMRDPVLVQRIRGTQYRLTAGCMTIELTRGEAVRVAQAILKDSGEVANLA